MKKLLICLLGMFICVLAKAATETIKWYVDDNVYATTTCEAGGDIILPTSPTKYGYTFHGWEGYQFLEYIESTGTQYIDTGVKFYANNSTEVILDGEFVDKTSNINQHICCIGGNPKYSWISNFKSQNFSYGTGDAFASTGLPLTSTSPVSAKIYKNTFTISDGTNSYSYNDGTYNTIYDGSPLPLFARFFDANLQTVSGSKARVFNFKIIVNGVLVRDFIPVKRLRDNAIGMYDTVTKTFFENSGTGEFIAGPVINQ